MIQWVSELTIEWVSEWMNEWVSELTTEWVSEWVNWGTTTDSGGGSLPAPSFPLNLRTVSWQGLVLTAWTEQASQLQEPVQCGLISLGFGWWEMGWVSEPGASAPWAHGAPSSVVPKAMALKMYRNNSVVNGHCEQVEWHFLDQIPVHTHPQLERVRGPRGPQAPRFRSAAWWWKGFLSSLFTFKSQNRVYFEKKSWVVLSVLATKEKILGRNQEKRKEFTERKHEFMVAKKVKEWKWEGGKIIMT